mgnify:CR=1 FL=1
MNEKGEINNMSKDESKNEQKPEEKKSRFADWWNLDLKYTLIFTAIGIVVGIIDYLLVSAISAILITLLIFIGSALAAKRMIKTKEGMSWWFSKFIVYFFMAIIVWTIIYNINVIWV